MNRSVRHITSATVRARAPAQSIVEVVLAVTALMITGTAALALYTGALQQAFTRLVGLVNGI
jgi:hypothetical protein